LKTERWPYEEAECMEGLLTALSPLFLLFCCFWGELPAQRQAELAPAASLAPKACHGQRLLTASARCLTTDAFLFLPLLGCTADPECCAGEDFIQM